MPLAEGPSIDGELLAVILLMLMGAAVLWAVAVIGGFFWARRAARGSGGYAVLWAAAAIVQCAPPLLGAFNSVLALGILTFAAQVVAFLTARKP